MQRVIDDEKMSNDHAEVIKEFSLKKSINIHYMKYQFGSNYVPAVIVMFVKKEEKNREVFVIIDDDLNDSGNAIQEYTQKYIIIWPLHIYPCQKIYFFGAKMYAVQYFQVCGSRMLWVV